MTVTEGGQDKEVVDKIGIEEACHDANNEKFHQTQDTPPMTGDLAFDLGFIGVSPACHQILQGTYHPPPTTDQYTCELLQHLKKPPNITSPPSALLTTAEFQSS